VQPAWRMASFCASGECIEVARRDDLIVLRDSTQPHGSMLYYAAEEWRSFVLKHEGWRVPRQSMFKAREGRATMVIIEVVASVIVAAGTIAAGTKVLVTCIYNRGRKAEREDVDRAKLAAELEELKKRLAE